MTKNLSRVFVLWVPIVAATSGLFLFAYWGLQQNYRVTFNDPQIQLAEDGAAHLNAGGAPADLVSRGIAPTDLASSLAPWVVVYDASGTPLESSAVLDGAPPHLPQGVFNESSWRGYAEQGIAFPVPLHETRFTWQPRAGVRQAVVLVHADNGYFVASGRNMREVESQVQVLTEGAGTLWGATELGTFIILFILVSLGWL